MSVIDEAKKSVVNSHIMYLIISAAESFLKLLQARQLDYWKSIIMALDSRLLGVGPTMRYQHYLKRFVFATPKTLPISRELSG